VHAFGGGERSPATIKVRAAVEEFPDWVDLFALGVLFVQGTFLGGFGDHRKDRIGICGVSSGSLAMLLAIRRALFPLCC
jgi:hypothetical protein